MRKEEFLQLLRQALMGDVPPGVLEENVRYYDSYITEEVRKGRTEEEVIAEIGDPRLIARTIEDTTEGASDGGYEDIYMNGQTRGGTYQDRGGSEERRKEQDSFHVYNLSGGIWRFLIPILVFVVLFSIISLLFTVVGGIFAMLSPILGPLLIIWFLVWIFRRSGRRW